MTPLGWTFTIIFVVVVLIILWALWPRDEGMY